MLTPSVTMAIAPWTKFDHVPEDVLTRAAEREPVFMKLAGPLRRESDFSP